MMRHFYIMFQLKSTSLEQNQTKKNQNENETKSKIKASKETELKQSGTKQRHEASNLQRFEQKISFKEKCDMKQIKSK